MPAAVPGKLSSPDTTGCPTTGAPVREAEGEADVTLLAAAGLERLGETGVGHPLSQFDWLPAPAQGAIGIERRGDDSRAAAMLEAIHDGPTGQRLAAERAFLAHLDGSCETPIGSLAELDGGNMRLRGEILRTDGTEVYNDDVSGAIEDGPEMGRAMAAKLLAQAGPNFF